MPFPFDLDHYVILNYPLYFNPLVEGSYYPYYNSRVRKPKIRLPHSSEGGWCGRPMTHKQHLHLESTIYCIYLSHTA